MSQNSEQDQNTQTGALLIFAILTLVIGTWLWEDYIQPSYVALWFYLRFALFSSLVKAMEFPYIREHAGDILFWLNTFLIDSHLPKAMVAGQIDQAYSFLTTIDRSTIKTIADPFVSNRDHGFTPIFNQIGRLSFIIVAPIYIYVAVKLYRKLITRNVFDNKFSLISFAETVAEGFPELLPVVYDNPQKHSDIDKGKWRMSPKILAYLKANNCIDYLTEKGVMKFTLNREAASELLEQQLGERWHGFGALSKEERIVAAIAMPVVDSPKIGVPIMVKLVKMLGYAYSSKPGFSVTFKALIVGFIPELFHGFNLKEAASKKMLPWSGFFKLFSDVASGYKESLRQIKYKRASSKEVNRIINSYSNKPNIQDAIKMHAYNYTVLASLIEAARKGGKLPSCTSLWLKGEDRMLFYVFNNLGRQVGWIECLGFWAHYIAEKKTGAPFPYPKIENGIDGIDEYLWSSFYEYIPFHDWDSEYDD